MTPTGLDTEARPGPGPVEEAAACSAFETTRAPCHQHGCAAARRLHRVCRGRRCCDRTSRDGRCTHFGVHRRPAVPEAVLVPRLRCRHLRRPVDLAGPGRADDLGSQPHPLLGPARDRPAQDATGPRRGDPRIRLRLGFLHRTGRHLEGRRLRPGRGRPRGNGTGRLPSPVALAADREIGRLCVPRLVRGARLDAQPRLEVPEHDRSGAAQPDPGPHPALARARPWGARGTALRPRRSPRAGPPPARPSARSGSRAQSLWSTGG